MDIGRAFTFVFDDEEWIKKILVGGLLSLIPLVGSFIVYGYMLEIVSRVYSDAEEPLPQWDDMGGYLARGFFLWIGVLIWFLPVTLLIGCVAVVLIVAGGSTGQDAAVAISTIAAIGLIGVMLFVILIWSVIVMPIILGRYAVKRSFGAMFQFGEIMGDIRQIGAMPILILLVIYFIAGFIGQLGFIACFVGIIFTSFYANVVTAHGAGQVYRRTLASDVAPPEASLSF